MEYVKFKRKDDLIGTIQSITKNEHLIYIDEKYGPSDSYSVNRVKFSLDDKIIGKRIRFDTPFSNWISGQYEITPDIILFEITMPVDDFGKNVIKYYQGYSIKDDKKIIIPVLIELEKNESIIRLKNEEDGSDRFVLHINANGYGSGDKRHTLWNNSVDYFLEIPSLKLLPNAYSSLRDKSIEISSVDDIKRIIDEDIVYEEIVNSFEKNKPFDVKNPRAEMLILKK